MGKKQSKIKHKPFIAHEVCWADVCDIYRRYGSKLWDSDLFHAFKVPDNDAYHFPRKAFYKRWYYEIGPMTPTASDPDFLIQAVKAWSLTRLVEWQRVWDALALQYNPLYNYDMTETITESIMDAASTETQTAGYDSGSLVQDGGAVSDNTRDRSQTTDKRGNIGVMSSQDLVLKEIDVAATDLMSQMLQEFKDEFCILVYD